MISIRQKIATEGIIPALTTEGLSSIFKLVATRNPKLVGGVYLSITSDDKATKDTRNIVLKRSKKPLDGKIDNETRFKYEASIFKYLQKIVKEKIAKKQSAGYFDSLSKEELEVFLNLDIEKALVEDDAPDFITDIYRRLCQLNNTHIGADIVADSNGPSYLPFDVEHKTKMDAKNNLPYDYKIYINTPDSESLYKFFDKYIKKCIDKNIPWDSKPGFNSGNSVDRTSLYVYEEYLDDVLQILEEIRREDPEIICECGSPMIGALNYSYYAIVDKSVRAGATYNDWFDSLCVEAFYCTIAEEVLKDSEFVKTLNEDEKQTLIMLAKMNGFEDILKQMNNTPMLSGEDSKIRQPANEQQIFNFYNATSGKNINALLQKLNIYANTKVINNQSKTDRLLSRFNYFLTTIASIKNFGDRTHADMPICLRQRFYEGGVDIDDARRVGLEDSSSQNIKRGRNIHKHEAQDRREIASFVLSGKEYNYRTLLEHKVRELGYKGSTSMKKISDLEKIYIYLLGIDKVLDSFNTINVDEQADQKISESFMDCLASLREERAKQICDNYSK